MASPQPSFAGEWEPPDLLAPDELPAPAAAPVTTARVVRMECVDCGSHVIVAAAARVGGQCTNCASYELQALRYENRRSDPAVRPEQRSDEPAPW
jgi:hypothetical protein